MRTVQSLGIGVGLSKVTRIGWRGRAFQGCRRAALVVGEGASGEPLVLAEGDAVGGAGVAAGASCAWAGIAGAGFNAAGASLGSTGLFWQPRPLSATSIINAGDISDLADRVGIR